MTDIVFTPENQKQLMLEIMRNHPALYQELKGINDFELQLAHICTYCNVVIDASCNVADMSRLFDTLYTELKKKTIITIP